jgi:outer membrane receptor protein involved in Fe transport
VGGAVCLVLLVAVEARGEPPPEDEDDGQVEKSYRTVVTPTRGPSNAFDSDRVLLRADEDAIMEAQPQDGTELIGAMPGAMLQRTNRGAGAPVLRGLIGPSNLVLVDGVRLNLSTFRTGPNQYTSLIDPMALESVEVLLGPGSVLYGSDAIGGVIHYRTRALPRRDGFGGRAMSRFASADLSTELALDAEGRAGGLAGWVGGSIRRHDILRSGGGASVPRSDFLQGDWRAKTRFKVGNYMDVTMGYLATHLEGATRIDRVHTGDLRVYTNRDQLAYLTASKRWMGDGLKRVEATVSYHGLLEIIERNTCDVSQDVGVAVAAKRCLDDDPAFITRKRRYEDDVDAMGVSLISGARWYGGRMRATLGIDARHERVASFLEDGWKKTAFAFERADRGNFSDGSTYSAFDAYVSMEGRPWVVEGKAELVVRGGARMSHVQAFAPSVPGLGDVTFEADSPVFDAGARLLVAHKLALFGSWSQGFRAPNLQETTVLGNTGTNFEIPNDELGPERSTTREIGARYMSGGLRLHAAWFVTDISDAITREDATFDGQEIYDGAPVVRRVNADQAHYEGYELALRTGRWKGLAGFGRLAWIQGTVRPAQKDAETEPARRVPPLMGAAGLRWRSDWKSLELSAWVEAAGAQTELSPGDRKDLRICENPEALGTTLGDACAGTPAWTTLHASARIRPMKDLDTALTVKNALDAAYRVHGSGFDAAGIDVRLTANLRF